MTINMNVNVKTAAETRRKLLRKRIKDSSPDIIFCQELPKVFNEVAQGYKCVSNGDEAAVMWNPERFEGQVTEVPGPTEEQRVERYNTTLIAIRKARNLLSKMLMVKLARENSSLSTLAVSYDGRSIGSEKLRHRVFSILVEFLKKVIAENGIDFCIIGGDIGLDTSTVKLLSKTKILSYESDKENDHPCMDYYILRGDGERGVKCVQNIKAVHFESQETPREHDEPSSSVRQNSTEPAKPDNDSTHVVVNVVPLSQQATMSSKRPWSNKCTIVAVLAAIDFLSGKGWLSPKTQTELSVNSCFRYYCGEELFHKGNELCEKLGKNQDGYCALEILVHSKLGFKSQTETETNYDETHHNFAGFLEYLEGLSKEERSAFVLMFPSNVGQPVSMVLLINELCESMLIDCQERSDGAVVATAPAYGLQNMIDYIEYMVKRDWGLTVSNGNRFDVTAVIIYKEMFLGCDWLIRVQLIPNITQNSAKICNTVQKSVTTVQKSVTTVQKSVTTVQKSVISSLSDGIYSLKNQKYGGRIFTFA